MLTALTPRTELDAAAKVGYLFFGHGKFNFFPPTTTLRLRRSAIFDDRGEAGSDLPRTCIHIPPNIYYSPARAFKLMDVGSDSRTI